MKIAIVSPRASALLHENDSEEFGGAEIQSCYVAALLAPICDVRFVVKQSDSPVRKDFDLIKVCHTYSEKKHNIRYIRFLYPRLILSFKALWEAKARIYYCRGPGEIVGITAAFCRIFNRKFIYAVSGNGELTGLREKIPNPVSRWMYILGIFFSDRLLCQSQDQILLLKGKYRKKAVTVNNIYPHPISCSCTHEKKYVTNIGSHRSLKRQHIFLELAQKLPDARFVCIGGGTGPYADHLKQKAKSIPNLQMIGHIAHDHVMEYLRSSYCLVNCSDNEGFPNIFLEAWGCGIPVVSYGFDPDRVIKRFELGKTPKNFEELVEDVNLIITNPHSRERFSRNGMNHVLGHHSTSAVKTMLCRYVIDNESF